MKKTFSLFLLATITFLSSAQKIDVQSYDLSFKLTDESDIIVGVSTIDILFLENCTDFELDLHKQDSSGKGMIVSSIIENDKSELTFKQVDHRIIIHSINGQKGKKHTYTIAYQGVPKNGLIIGENRHGNRTFFGDNWPNRAHYWFPCIDHPSDKATVSYTVEAPQHYSCVANGMLIDEKETSSSTKITRYEGHYPLPTKVMVIGLADFLSKSVGNHHDIEVTNWVYPEDKKAGFYDMEVAPQPLNFFIDNIAEYPFDKLYNVQSTTRFGGMENAGCIFYDENAVKGKNTMERLIAHEIAHQWFGNSATEDDWEHLWLSEGFATYFTGLYLEDKYGREELNTYMDGCRDRVTRFFKQYKTPVVDTISQDLIYLLNPNSYQKGAWFLHMLRHKIGEDAFWQGVRNYYSRFKYSNASTSDFKKEMEAVAHKDLSSFFNQWLRSSGHPILEIQTTHSEQNGSTIEINQLQDLAFTFPITIEFYMEDGTQLSKEFLIEKKVNTLPVSSNLKITKFQVDPKVNLLFEQAKRLEE